MRSEIKDAMYTLRMGDTNQQMLDKVQALTTEYAQAHVNASGEGTLDLAFGTVDELGRVAMAYRRGDPFPLASWLLNRDNTTLLIELAYARMLELLSTRLKAEIAKESGGK